MIDLVDLAQARRDSNWQRRGFLDKVFLPDEQQRIRTASDPDRMVWTLWSMKESVYKQHSAAGRAFVPLQIHCFELDRDSGLGRVSYQQSCLYTQTQYTQRYILTLASTAPVFDRARVLGLAESSYASQHGALRQAIRSEAALRYGDGALVKDADGAPYWQQTTTGLNIPLGISHHGHYGAFVLPTV